MLATTSQHDRVTEIDFLRFGAAIAVAFFHYAFRGYVADGMSILPYPELAPVAKYGYLGVELFFMISGFVILMTAATGTLRRFFVSRIARLYPAFWVCCTLTFLTILAIGQERYSASLYQYLVNLTMFSNIARVPPIDGVYWSLFVELRFYALVVLVLVLRRIHHAQGFLVAWLVLTIALDLWPVKSLRWIFLADYAVYFIAGATMYLTWSKGASLIRLSVIVATWFVALRQALARVEELEQQFGTDYDGYVVMGVVSAFFVIMSLVSLRKTARFGHPLWVVVGALTYPFYLLHQNIGFMIFNVGYPAINRHLLLWGTLAVMVGLSYAVHVVFERPLSAFLKRVLNGVLDAAAALPLRRAESPPERPATPVSEPAAALDGTEG